MAAFARNGGRIFFFFRMVADHGLIGDLRETVHAFVRRIFYSSNAKTLIPAGRPILRGTSQNFYDNRNGTENTRGEDSLFLLIINYLLLRGFLGTSKLRGTKVTRRWYIFDSC
jgi:hypothetical protein